MNELGESAAEDQTKVHHDGDNGRTVFGSHGDVSKNDLRVAAHAECDAASAAVAMAIAGGGLPPHITSMLVSIQNDIFDLIADLLVPVNSHDAAQARIIPEHISRLERAIEHFKDEADDLSGMVLPVGTVAAALLYQARAVVRRAERALWAALEAHGDVLNPETGRYLNRLSTVLFVLGRGANAEHGDVMWEPESSVRGVLEDQPDNG